jgi:hypothetical protein
MHAAWGAGFLAGCARFGVPARGLVALLRGSVGELRYRR